MKLSEIDYQTETPREIEIKDHKGQSFNPPAFVSVYAFTSKFGANATLEMQRTMLKMREDENNLDKNKDMKNEIIQKCLYESLATLTTGWTGINDDDDKPIDFSKEKAIELYSQYPIIFNTVERFCSDVGNYLGKPQPTSLRTPSKAVGTQPSPTSTKSKKQKS